MPVPSLFEPTPFFTCASVRNKNFTFNTLAGNAVVLSFFGSAGHPLGQRLAQDLMATAERPGKSTVFCGVTFDPADRDPARVGERPAFVLFHDETLAVGKLWGVVAADAQPSQGMPFHPVSFVLDERLRVYAVLPVEDAASHVASLRQVLDSMPRPGGAAQQQAWAPVLAVPRVFEPDFCRRLIAYYESTGGQPSGFMREREGRTFGVLDNAFKRRFDAQIQDPELKQAGRARVARRLVPEIQRAFQFTTTHIERDIIACYDASEGGFFRSHRDNTTRATAHRRFAVTINLNAEDYDGGNLRFPEFGQATYRAETGGAVVFSCSLLHEATPMTRGKRYCYLPFLYDAAGAALRKENEQFLDSRVLAADEKTVLHDPKAGAL